MLGSAAGGPEFGRLRPSPCIGTKCAGRMTTLDVKPFAMAPDPSYRWKVMTAVLAVMSLALALVLATTTGFIGGQSDMEALAGDYNAAWASLDGDAVAGFFPANGRIQFIDGTGTYIGPESVATYANNYPAVSVLESGDLFVDGSYAVSPFRWNFGGIWGDAEGLLEVHEYGSAGNTRVDPVVFT